MSKNRQRRRVPVLVMLKRLAVINILLALIGCIVTLVVPSIDAYLDNHGFYAANVLFNNTSPHGAMKALMSFASCYIGLFGLELGVFWAFLIFTILTGRDMLSGPVYFIAGMERPKSDDSDRWA